MSGSTRHHHGARRRQNREHLETFVVCGVGLAPGHDTMPAPILDQIEAVLRATMLRLAQDRLRSSISIVTVPHDQRDAMLDRLERDARPGDNYDRERTVFAHHPEAFLIVASAQVAAA